jgi:hypothetical protein
LAISDFTVEIRHLPKVLDYHTLFDLKALLWNHLENVLSTQPNCIKSLRLSKFGDRVYAINFGMFDYSRLKQMILIYKDTQRLILEEARIK